MSDATHILVVDDQIVNLMILEELLGTRYRVHALDSARAALAYLESGGAADLVLMDVLMPDMDGFEACRLLLAMPGRHDTPLIFLTSLDSPEDERRALSLGAVDFIRKPLSPPVVLARIETHLELSRARRLLALRNRDLESLVAERTREVEAQAQDLIHSKQELIAAQGATITAFCALVEVRDNETGNHILRTQRYVRSLALHLRTHPRFSAALDDDTIESLYKSAPLHDVGKVAIPDRILLKPGKLDADEWAIMQRHCEYGRDAIRAAELALGDTSGSFLRTAREIAYSHHERWDGSGYPCALAGEAIPLSARLMALADVYDALISARPYKRPFSHAQALESIMAGRGGHFDPDVADAFLEIAQEFRDIAGQLSDAAVPAR
jgi:putative two-component system response regulator